MLASTPTVPFCNDVGAVPLYWTDGYKLPWQAFQQALVNYVNGAPYTTKIGYIRFGIGAGGEDFPADKFADPGCLAKKWAPAGLTATVWLNWSLIQIDDEATLGSIHPINVGINDFPGTSPAGLVPDGVAAEAVRQGLGFGMQGMTITQLEDFNAGRSSLSSCEADWCALFARFAGQVPLEVQPHGQTAPDGTCAAGIAVADCSGSLSALLNSPTSSMITQTRAQVIELYPQDWLVADDPSWAPATGSYVAYHVAYAGALGQAACEVGGQAGVVPPGCVPFPEPWPTPLPPKPTCTGDRCT